MTEYAKQRMEWPHDVDAEQLYEHIKRSKVSFADLMKHVATVAANTKIEY
jgi:hypothetical protein